MKESNDSIKNENSEIKEDKKEEKKQIKTPKNKCHICSQKYSKNPSIKCIFFDNCNHEICYICLYKILIRSYIKSISKIFTTNNKLKISCICELGSTELSIQEILSLLTSLNNTTCYNKIEKIENFVPKEVKCENHNLPINKYCLECCEPLCSECINDTKNKDKKSFHFNHKTVDYKEFYTRLYKNLEEIPNLNIILNDRKKLEENFYEKYSELINIKFENLINEINYIKEKILNNLKQEYEKYKQSIEAIYLLYQYYNYELISVNQNTDINQLMFLYNTNISLPELNYQFSKAENILNKILKELNETNLDKMFEYKFNPINAQPYKCIQTIPDTHTTNITSISKLYNNKIVSGDFDGNLKIWKQTLNRYILFQDIKNVCQGAINSISRIKLNKFAVCSSYLTDIYIFQENINTEKYILIQTIKITKETNQEQSKDSEAKKYFNKITTLNDGNSLIASTNDNYLYIFQDKIGGIPKQNYMKTNYELVEFFDTYHTKPINFILHTLTENIITASEDATIKVWNKDRKYITLLDHEDSVNVMVEIDKNKIASGGSDRVIIIWELILNSENSDNSEYKYVLKEKLVGHEFSVIGLDYLNNDRLISASIDDTIKIWQRNKYDNYINKVTIKEQKLGIEGLVNINNFLFVTFSLNKTIKVWTTYKNEEINVNIEENKNKNLSEENDEIINKRVKRTESVDYMVKNSIQELTDKEKEKEKEEEKKSENKNQILEINTSSNQK